MPDEDDEQYSLRWNNFHSNLSGGFTELMEDEDLVDVTISAEGQFIKAHKAVLAVCSPYFKDLFKMNPCKHPVIILKDVSYTELEDILQFIYKGEVYIQKEKLQSFLSTGKSLQVKGLADGDSYIPPVRLPTNDVTLVAQPAQQILPVPSLNSHIGNSQTSTASRRVPYPVDIGHPTPHKQRRTEFHPARMQHSNGSISLEPCRNVLDNVKAEPGCLDLNNIEIVEEDNDLKLFNSLFFREDEISNHYNLESLNDSTQQTQVNRNSMANPIPQTQNPVNRTSITHCIPPDPPGRETEPKGIESFEKLQFIKSTRGLFQLVFNGFVFNRNTARGGSTYWRCLEYPSRGCRGRCTTTESKRLIFRGKHKHAPHKKKLLKKTLYSAEDIEKLNPTKENGFEGSSLLGN